MALSTPGAFDAALDRMTGIIDLSYDRLFPHVQSLLGYVIVIELAFLFLLYALGREETIADMIRKVMMISVFVWLVADFQDLIGIIFRSAAQIGVIAGSPGPVDQGVVDRYLSPSTLIGTGVRTFGTILDSINGINTPWPWEFDKIHKTMAMALMLILVGLIVLLGFVIGGLRVFMTTLEFHLLTALVVVLLPFGILRPTSFVAERSFAIVVSLSVKMMVTLFILTLVETLVADMGSAAAGELTWPLIISYLIVGILVPVLLWVAPNLAAGLMSGNPSLSAGQFVVSAAVMGGTVLGAGAAGAVGAKLIGAAGAARAAGGAVAGGPAGPAASTAGPPSGGPGPGGTPPRGVLPSGSGSSPAAGHPAGSGRSTPGTASLPSAADAPAGRRPPPPPRGSATSPASQREAGDARDDSGSRADPNGTADGLATGPGATRRTRGAAAAPRQAGRSQAQRANEPSTARGGEEATGGRVADGLAAPSPRDASGDNAQPPSAVPLARQEAPRATTDPSPGASGSGSADGLAQQLARRGVGQPQHPSVAASSRPSSARHNVGDADGSAAPGTRHAPDGAAPRPTDAAAPGGRAGSTGGASEAPTASGPSPAGGAAGTTAPGARSGAHPGHPGAGRASSGPSAAGGSASGDGDGMSTSAGPARAARGRGASAHQGPSDPGDDSPRAGSPRQSTSAGPSAAAARSTGLTAQLARRGYRAFAGARQVGNATREPAHDTPTPKLNDDNG